MNKGDLLFIHDTNWIAQEIEEITHSKYSHCCIYIGNGKVIEAQGLRKVGTRKLSFYDGKYDVVETKLNKQQFAQGIKWLILQKGRLYDYWDIFVLWCKFRLKLNIPWHEGKRILCSRLGRDFLFNCGINIPDENMTPEDLYEWCIEHIH